MLISYKGKEVKLPDFLIVGAQKSGTTSLHYYLKQHPQIFMPKVKELWFFSFMDAPPEWVRERAQRGLPTIIKLDDYISYFAKASDSQVMGEACPIYLYKYSDTIRNIKRVYREKHKDLKIIIILRNPAERALSHFMMNRRQGEPLEDLMEAVKLEVIDRRLEENWSLVYYDYVGFGMYHEQVRAFMEEFPHAKVFLYDEFCVDALKVVREIFAFLGVDKGFTSDVGIRHNVSGDTRFGLLDRLVHAQYPLKRLLKLFVPHEMRQRLMHKVDEKNIQRKQMPDDIRKELIERYYKDNILKLQKLINRDLSSWLV